MQCTLHLFLDALLDGGDQLHDEGGLGGRRPGDGDLRQPLLQVVQHRQLWGPIRDQYCEVR